MKNFKEEYKIIEGFENYEVSNLGNIRNAVSKHVLKVKIDRYGYAQIGLYQGRKQHWKTVHRLVATAFIPNPHNKQEVNHISADPMTKLTNHVGNLEWATRQENVDDAISKGIHGKKKTLPEQTIEYIREVYTPRCKQYGAIPLAKKFGVSQSTISNIANYSGSYALKQTVFKMTA